MFSESESANQKAKRLRELHKELTWDIAWIRKRMKEYADKKRVEGPTLREGDKVYLRRKNLKTTRPSEKLDYTKLGPFRILKKKSDVNYDLDLPKKMRIHPTFHISLLEPANSSTPV